MKDSLISIALASYNGEKFIREQLDSIISQTYTDWELIVTDDCSTDNTWEILQEYNSKDSRIRIYENEHNLGFKKNFEKAIGLCKGEYIALSDQDDIWVENHLKVLLANLGDKTISCGNALMIDSEGKSLNKKLSEVDKLYSFPEKKILYKYFFHKNAFQGASMLMRRSFALSCLPVPDSIGYHDSWLAYCACLENGISYTFEVVTKYRQHGNNVTFVHHNKSTESLPSRLERYKEKIFQGTPCDRFYYADHLFERYGNKNKEFADIYTFFSHRAKRKVSFSDLKMLWKNYQYIRTKKGHAKFLQNLFRWLSWKKPV